MVLKSSNGEKTKFESLPFAPLGIITLEGCKALAEKVNNYLLGWRNEAGQLEMLVTCPGYKKDDTIISSKCDRFTNGEGKAVIQESVRGDDIFIFVDVGNYSIKYRMYDMEVPMSPDDHYQDLKRIISAIAGKARRVSVIMPMLYESRQHGRHSRESLDCAVMLQELAAMGVTNIITFDAHDPEICNSVPLIGFENIRPSYQLLKALLRKEKNLNISKEKMMVVSPDEGAIERNIYYSALMGIDLGMFYKRRDYTKVVNGRNPIIAHEYVGDSVEGKDILIVDDIIASGDSVLDIAYELKKRKAGRIFAFATFGLFTEGLARFDEAYKNGMIDGVYSTNLTYTNPDLATREWYTNVDMSKYLAYIIATLNHDAPLYSMLDPYDKIKKLLAKYREENNQNK